MSTSAPRRSPFEYMLLGVLGVAVAGSTFAVATRSGNEEFFDPLITVKSFLDRQYVDTLTPEKLEKMQTGAITGMLEALGDPYTLYVPPSETREFNKELLGEYVGIGAQVNVRDNTLVIVSPLEDSPAFRAGLLPDDKITEIEGQSTLGKSVDWCIDRLLGEPDTVVNLVVDRGGKQYPLSLVRKPIKTRSVKGLHRDDANPQTWDYILDHDHGIGYLRVTQFTPGLTREVAEAMLASGAATGQLKGLVLDLRFNPGGLLSEAIGVADLFLKEGVIVSTRGRAFAPEVARAQAPGTLPDFPIAVLINGQSASASEILAGALVENNRAIAVGTRTFGKGSVQSVKPIPALNEKDQPGELKITEQGYYLPSGRSLMRKDDSTEWGVDPTKGFYVPLTDAQLLEMLTTQRKLDIIRGSSGDQLNTAIVTPHPQRLPAEAAPAVAAATETLDWESAEWVLTHLKDPQLTAAVRAVQGKLATGAWTPTGEEGITGQLIATEELKRARDLQTRLGREMLRIGKRIDTLETTSGAKPETPPDLWADTIDVTGGRVEIFDKDGKVVATLAIPDNTLEAWLIDADLKPVAGSPVSQAPAAKPATP